jgi:hypothetical protein
MVPAAGVERDFDRLGTVRAGDERLGLGGSVTEREFFLQVLFVVAGMKINHQNLVLALAVMACSEDVTPPPEFTGGGPTTFRLTDAPFPYDKVSRVDVFVVKVQASWAADTSAAATNDFITVANVNRKINLLSLEGGLSDVLGTANVPKGAIKAIRLIIDTDQSSITMKTGAVLTGSTNPGIAWQSSAGIATLNATVEDNIAVPDEGTDVVIDMDAGKSFIDPTEVEPPCGCSGFIFSPILRAAQISRTGTLTGFVRLGSSTGAGAVEATVQLKLGNPNNPQNTWATVSTARTDADGSFRFAYVRPSAKYPAEWSYMVVASKAGTVSAAAAATVYTGLVSAVAQAVVLPSSGTNK